LSSKDQIAVILAGDLPSLDYQIPAEGAVFPKVQYSLALSHVTICHGLAVRVLPRGKFFRRRMVAPGRADMTEPTPAPKKIGDDASNFEARTTFDRLLRQYFLVEYRETRSNTVSEQAVNRAAE